jgi:hypothetical protein
MGMMQWLLIRLKPAIKGCYVYPCGDTACRQIFLEMTDCRPGSKRLCGQVERPEAREMRNRFINLEKKRKRSGKFFCRLFAFLSISAAAPGGGIWILPGAKAFYRWVIFSRQEAGKMIFLPPLRQLPARRMFGYLTF